MPKTHIPLPSQADLRETFDYDPAAGVLSYKKAPGSRADLVGKPAGTAHPDGYIRICFRGRRYLAHRAIWVLLHGEDPGSDEIDHKNRNRANNRPENLRRVAPEHQPWNRSLNSNNTVGFRGVTRNRSGGFQAQISSHGRRVSLGVFATPEEAAQAYQLAVEARNKGLTSEHPLPDCPQGVEIRPPHQRQRLDNTSGFRNVSRSSTGKKWVAYLNRGGVRTHLGTFDTPEAAAAAYKQAKEALK